MFYEDLKRGKYHEKRILKKLQKKYPKANIIQGYCKDYDIWVPEIDCGVEVKFDEMSKKTGNIVVEIEFNGKPSALSTTKAKYWIITDGEKDKWFTPNAIKQCISDNNLRPTKFTGRGDQHSKIAYLIKKPLLYPYSL